MATKIEDIKEAINTKLASVLTGYSRLPNPYGITESAMLRMTKAYAVATGVGVNTERFVDCHSTWERNFTIAIINKVTSTANNIEGREEFEKALLVAHRDVLESFHTDPTMSAQVIKATIVNDGGINFLDGQDGKYLAIEIGLSVEYIERFET